MAQACQRLMKPAMHQFTCHIHQRGLMDLHAALSTHLALPVRTNMDADYPQFHP
jgi:hypothetical protein